ncbi:MAG: hypothetical protein DRI89_12970 [Bacteroidetes bacterium]|nr:MAG: hypothetical protein DRI89_12970 [Bacteroidota bacterium]
MDTDWATPANSTFSKVQNLGVNAFSGNFSGDWNNIPQPGTPQKLDGISTVLMYRAQYRNFDGTQKIVCTHTIAESSTEAVLRWYELENTGSSWAIVQQGTYNPDNVSRWNASIAMNDAGQIAMGYSVANSSIYPGIRYCGQTAGAASGIMDIAETNIWTGAYSQTGINRWGDYSNISVDPAGGTGFWYTNEYKSSSSHGTRIAEITFPASCTTPTTQASNYSLVSASDNSLEISWNRGNGDAVLVVAREGNPVNANPISGNTYTANTVFGTGDEIGVGNFVVYNGAGTSVIINSLEQGTNYHFSIYEYFNSGVCYAIPRLTANATTSGCTPCVSDGNTAYQTSTTYVGINTLSKASAKPAAYSDYTAISTNLEVGSTHNLNVRVNTDGPYTVHTKVWIDWNQDCDFDDTGETFDLGTATNVTDGLTNLSPLSTSVPVDALIGSTIMRVSTKFNSDPTSCETAYDGEVEDYTINVLPGSTTWNGTNTDWNDSDNWPNGVVPNSSYEVVIPTAPVHGSFPVIQSGVNAKCYSLTLENGATITINGTLEEVK